MKPTEQTTQTAETQTAQTKTIFDDGLSLSEYESLRRGETIEVKAQAPQAAAEPSGQLSALGQEPEQKKSGDSETSEAEEQGDEPKDESEAAGEEPRAEDGSTKSKKKTGFQRRIDKLNQAKAAAQQEAEYWKRRALEGATPESKTQSDPIDEKRPAAGEGKPKPENFETHAEFVEALTDWKTDQKLAKRDQKAEQSRLEIEQANLVRSYSVKQKAFAEKTSDYDDVISEVDHIPISPLVRSVILESENGPELAYELAKRPEEYARINALGPVAAARELGKFEARLQKPSETKVDTKKVTQAPKPIEPVGKGVGQGSTQKSIYDADKMSLAEYEALRREQIKRRRA